MFPNISCIKQSRCHRRSLKVCLSLMHPCGVVSQSQSHAPLWCCVSVSCTPVVLFTMLGTHRLTDCTRGNPGDIVLLSQGPHILAFMEHQTSSKFTTTFLGHWSDNAWRKKRKSLFRAWLNCSKMNLTTEKDTCCSIHLT